MSGPYITNGQYRYGVTELAQPCPAKYNHMLHHKGRDLSECTAQKIRDDGYPYLSNSYYKEPSFCIGCRRCMKGNGVDRSALVSNVINVETESETVVTITFYGTKEEYDSTVRLNIGSKYCMSYVTETGVQSVKGILRGFSDNLPDECTKWIGVYGNTTATNAYLELDCSTEGLSDKRLIYIASLRHIEPIYDEAYEEWAPLSQIEKMELICQKITDSINDITEYLEKTAPEEPDPEDPVKPTDPSTGTPEGPQIEPPNPGGFEGPSYEGMPGTETPSTEEETKPTPGACVICGKDHDCSCKTGPYIYGTVPLTRPPIPSPPWFWHHYFDKSCGCGDGSGTGSGSTGGEGSGSDTEEEFDAEEALKNILAELEGLGEVFKAFVVQYNADQEAEGCPCCPKPTEPTDPEGTVN